MPSALFDSLLLNASHSSLPRSQIPAFLYGCAWKKDRTADLVYQALSTGFRGVDVAAQPKHYREELAGEGIRRAIAEGKCKREELFIQTKFTSVAGQDPTNLPYDPSLPVRDQVEASLAFSLRNLRHSDEDSAATYIDSVILHSPLPTMSQTQEAWSTLEAHVPSKIHNLGISNVTLPILETLYSTSRIKPAVVQNRFYSDTEYDVPLRRFCREKGIVYQSFWTLTANPRLLRHSSVTSVARACDVDAATALYALLMGLEGIIVCNGTKSHMQSDLEGLQRVKAWANAQQNNWSTQLRTFKDATGDNDPRIAPA